MLANQLSVIIIIICALVLFIWGRWRYDIVAGIALAATVFTGALPFASAFTGFSNPAVITVAAVMVISQVISNSGIIDHTVKRLSPFTNHPITHITVLSIIAAVLSAFMNNIGALTLLMPIAMQSALRAGRSPAMLLMPLAFASILGGMMTLIGTPPNILISSYRMEAIGQPFNMFAFAPVGVGIVIVGLIYIAVLGWRLIPKARFKNKASEQVFHIKDYITELRVTEKSSFIDQALHKLVDSIDGDILILGLIRDKNIFRHAIYDKKLCAGDILIVSTTSKVLEKIIPTAKLDLVGSPSTNVQTLKSDESGIIEVVVAPGSKIEGQSVQRLQLRSRYGINLLAVSRQGKPFRQRLRRVALNAGDILLMQGEASSLSETVTEIGFLPLMGRGLQIGMKRWTFLPLLIFAIAIGLTAFNVMPIQIAFSAAALTMVVFNMIPIRKAYESIDWSIIILLGAMIPVGEALVSTGASSLIGNSIAHLSSVLPPIAILGLVLVVAMILTDIINNAATAVVMAPIALSIAQSLNYNVDPFLMAVAIGSSSAFLTPIGHQNNTIVMGPGGYHFGDYWRMGLLLKILIIIVALPLIQWVWPLQ